MNTSSIGNRIKLLRKSENLTQIDFANRLLISQSYLSGIENGNETPTDKLLKLICLEFGINEIWLSDAIGEMYMNICENDKSDLLNISNEALIKIISMLSTKSNIEYGFCAHAIRLLAQILDFGENLNDSSRLLFLIKTEVFMLNFEHMLQVVLNEDEWSIINNKKNVLNDIDDIISLIHNNNPTSK